MRIREFEAIKDFGELVMSGPMSYRLKQDLKEVFEDAFASDYVDFLKAATEEIPILFEESMKVGGEDTFEDIIKRWVDRHMDPVLH